MNKIMIIILITGLLFPQKTYEFTEEEVKSLYNSIQELENADSTNQKIIENLNEQIYMYIQQTEIDSTIIENYKEQLELKEEFIKELKPSWYDNKYLWYSMGIASMIVPIWGIGQLK
jgi:membrane-bound ClpP family serine protease